MGKGKKVLKKLNFGCGNRISSAWINVDFHSSVPGVISANFINGLPFPDDTFDVVYSSHVLEHFTEYQGKYLLKEAFRVLKNGGIIRIAVPDLEGTVKEYIRILNLEDVNPYKTKLYDWIILELLDQLVRTKNPSKMQSLIGDIFDGSDETMINYLRSRTESKLTILPKANQRNNSSLLFRLRHLTFSKLKIRFTYYYLILIGKMIPSSIKPLVFKEISIGEQHQWM